MNIIKYKYFYFLISLAVVVPGLVSLFLFGLNLSIDFTGGSNITLSFPNNVSSAQVQSVKTIFAQRSATVYTIEPSGKEIFLKTNPLTAKENNQVMANLNAKLGKVAENEFETIGPVIGAETTNNAIKAVLLASLLIVIYITYVFRKVPKPASSFRFGVSVVAALLHDVLVVVGIFSILGHVFKVQIDSLFVTAVLTIIGFSVHDTIVVFDRIRENLDRMPGRPFAEVVNDSILQTINRSLNTSLTVVLVLFALLLFGGETIRWFVVALLVGIVSGTYSSIFNASPILVVWHEWSLRRKSRN